MENPPKHIPAYLPTHTPAEKLRLSFKKSWHALALLAGMALVGFLLYGTAAEGYRWQWYRVWPYPGVWEDGAFHPGPLLEGLLLTLLLTAAGMLLALGTGLATALARLSASPPARLLAQTFLACIRNTPLLMQLFVAYFVVAPVFNLGPFASATLALGFFEGAYLSEIFRAGILSLPAGQWEAAYSLGMGVLDASRLIILPQALRAVLPALTSQLISLVKDTSLVSAIAVADLTMRARDVIADTYLSFEIWLLTAAIYLFLAGLVSALSLLLKKRRQRQPD